MNGKIQIVTVATHKTGYIDQLSESCKKGGSNLKIIGLGEKWEGFSTKLKLMCKFLKSVDPTSIVVFDFVTKVGVVSAPLVCSGSVITGVTTSGSVGVSTGGSTGGVGVGVTTGGTGV